MTIANICVSVKNNKNIFVNVRRAYFIVGKKRNLDENQTSRHNATNFRAFVVVLKGRV